MDAELRRQLDWGRDALAAREGVHNVPSNPQHVLPLLMTEEALAVVVHYAGGLFAADRRTFHSNPSSSASSHASRDLRLTDRRAG